MYTLQSGQIENALRMGGASPDISAKEMVQALANCQAPLQHRSQVSISQPTINYFPTVTPPGTHLSFPSLNFNTIQVPPWQMVPFTPLPYPEWPDWKDVVYTPPDWWGPGLPAFEHPPAIITTGPVQTGPVATPSVTTVVNNSQTINNAGDIVNNGDVFNDGSTYVNGDMIVDKSVTHKSTVINKGPVYNDNRVYNRSEVHNEIAHNYITHNHGVTHHHNETNLDGPTYMTGPTMIAGPIFINGQLFDPLPLTVVTDVVWEDNALKKKTRSIMVLGTAKAEATTTVIEGTACQ